MDEPLTVSDLIILHSFVLYVYSCKLFMIEPNKLHINDVSVNRYEWDSNMEIAQ